MWPHTDTVVPRYLQETGPSDTPPSGRLGYGLHTPPLGTSRHQGEYRAVFLLDYLGDMMRGLVRMQFVLRTSDLCLVKASAVNPAASRGLAVSATGRCKSQIFPCSCTYVLVHILSQINKQAFVRLLAMLPLSHRMKFSYSNILKSITSFQSPE